MVTEEVVKKAKNDELDWGSWSLRWKKRGFLGETLIVYEKLLCLPISRPSLCLRMKNFFDPLQK